MDGKSWEESPLNVPEGLKEGAPKMTQVKTDRVFKGDVEGTGKYSYAPLPANPRISVPDNTSCFLFFFRCWVLPDGISP